MPDLQPIIQPVINEAIEVHSGIRALLIEAIDDARKLEQQDLASHVYAFGNFISDRNQALVWLIQAGYLWDAGIIVRCVMEAAFKAAFVCYAEPGERKCLLEEYWHDLHDIGLLKVSTRATGMLDSQARASDWERSLRPLVLDKKEEQELQQKFPRRRRQELEQKWSTSEILRHFQGLFQAKNQYPVVAAGTYSYGLSSHFLHADSTSMYLVYDRSNRPETERLKLSVAHSCRLISDSLHYFAFLLVSITQALSLDSGRLKTLTAQMEPLTRRLCEVEEEFWATQAAPTEISSRGDIPANLNVDGSAPAAKSDDHLTP